MNAAGAASADELPVAAPTHEAVRAQLGRIRASPDFDVPDRARAFLSYVVEETLAGRADRIKAYSIALEVFGRDAGFDAQSDPVVRIEAGRVRRALERYYLTAGREDGIVITIPKGGYVPAFAAQPASPRAEAPAASVPPAPPARPVPWRWQLASAALAAIALVAIGWSVLGLGATPAGRVASPDIPTLRIAPFEDLTGDAASALVVKGLTEEIIGQLARFKELVILDGSGGAALSGTPARYELAGSVRISGRSLRLSARLRSAADGAVVWAQHYDADLQVQELLAVEAAIAQEVTGALAQPYGVIFNADLRRVTETPPDDWEAYTCTLAYYTYRTDFSPELRRSVTQCLARTVEKYPAYASAWALLAIGHLDAFFRTGIDARDAGHLAASLQAARRSVDLDPNNVRGLQAYMMALFLGGEVDAALTVGAQALRLNPNDSELRAEYGLRLALSGRWEEGGELIAEALSRSPGLQPYYEATLALAVYMQGDAGTAAMLIRKADIKANPLFHLIAAAIYGRVPSAGEAARERAWIVANAADVLANIEGEVALRMPRRQDRDYFLAGLKLAGLPVP